RSYPREAVVKRIKLWISRPAATRTIKERAISATTRLRVVRWLIAARVAAGWDCFNASFGSSREAFHAGPTPNKTLVSIARMKVKTRASQFTEIGLPGGS